MKAGRWTFGWRESTAQLAELAAGWPLRGDGRGNMLAAGLRCSLPAVLPIAEDGEEVTAYLERLPAEPGIEVVLLMQAGAASLGLWLDDRLIDHVATKRYVVRGTGRAQPSHLRTKGKSRYGSRLRLQNHQRLLDEVIERLRSWAEHEGAFDRLHYSLPGRLWDELLLQSPPPPFRRGDPGLCRVKMDVHVPDHAELLRVRWALTRGVVEVD